MRDRDLEDGQHRNDTEDLSYFTTAYFHRPEELVQELESAGFQDACVFGVEGPGWILPDFDARWEDTTLRADLLALARALEREPSIRRASAHLLVCCLQQSFTMCRSAGVCKAISETGH